MKIFKTRSLLSRYLKTCNRGSIIGFVPTMGNLHRGHLSLFERAKKECSIVIVSIFVNPTQFNNVLDFKSYPRTINEDLKKLEKMNCNIVYIPKTDDLYSKKEVVEKFSFNGLDSYMEGAFRKNHFNGVATIIKKLFFIIRPEKAYFGEKDLQQLIIIQYLTKKLNLKIEIVPVTTVRLENGVAISSRNNFLSKEALGSASLIFDCLMFCKENIRRDSVPNLKRKVVERFAKSSGLELEYIEFVNLKDLSPIVILENSNKHAICIAAYIEGVRLIDNIIL